MSKRCGEVMFDLIMSITFVHIWQRFILGRLNTGNYAAKLLTHKRKNVMSPIPGWNRVEAGIKLRRVVVVSCKLYNTVFANIMNIL